MKRSLSAFLFLIAFAQASAAAESAQFPCDVMSFIERRDLCDHFRGEEPYDAERATFLESNIAELCTGTDKQLEELKRKYAGHADVLAKLSEYELQVEPFPPQ